VTTLSNFPIFVQKGCACTAGVSVFSNRKYDANHGSFSSMYLHVLCRLKSEHAPTLSNPQCRASIDLRQILIRVYGNDGTHRHRTSRGERAKCRGLFSPAGCRAPPPHYLRWLPQHNMSLGATRVRTGTPPRCTASRSVELHPRRATYYHQYTLRREQRRPPCMAVVSRGRQCASQPNHTGTLLLPHGNHLHWESSARINNQRSTNTLRSRMAGAHGRMYARVPAFTGSAAVSSGW
jgi:hypothetical protein